MGRCGFRFLTVYMLVGWSLSASCQFKHDRESMRLTAPRGPVFGISAGVGGVYGYFGPGFFVRYRPVVLHVVPGVASAGVSLAVPLGPKLWDPGCVHRPFFVELVAVDDWLLGNTLRPDHVSNRRVFMGLVGLHQRLDVRDRKFLEVSVGVAYQQNRLRATESQPASTNTLIYPMLSLRMAGFVRTGNAAR